MRQANCIHELRFVKTGLEKSERANFLVLEKVGLKHCKFVKLKKKGAKKDRLKERKKDQKKETERQNE